MLRVLRRTPLRIHRTPLYRMAGAANMSGQGAYDTYMLESVNPDEADKLAEGFDAPGLSPCKLFVWYIIEDGSCILIIYICVVFINNTVRYDNVSEGFETFAGGRK